MQLIESNLARAETWTRDPDGKLGTNAFGEVVAPS